MNKFFKTIVIGSLVVVAVVFLLIGFAFYKLPSAQSISKVVKQSMPKPPLSGDSSAEPKVAPSASSVAAAAVDNKDDSDDDEDAETAELNEKVFRDLTAPENPLSNFCGSLKNAKTGVFSEQSFNQAFLDSIEPDKQDPRIQAAKPLFRYILRLPKMNQFVAEVEAAVEKDDQGILDKAQFYASAYSAFSEMKEHQVDLESVLDRGYLFIGLNNLIAKKPELVNDPKVQSFCNNTENLFNQSSPVDFDREKKDFLSLLHDSGVQPNDISFNPNYKTKVDLNLDGKALTLQGGWLEDIIKDDQANAVE